MKWLALSGGLRAGDSGSPNCIPAPDILGTPVSTLVPFLFGGGKGLLSHAVCSSSVVALRGSSEVSAATSARILERSCRFLVAAGMSDPEEL